MNPTVKEPVESPSVLQLDYRRFRPPFDPRWRFMNGFSPAPRRVLDVGCGPGWTLRHFSEIYPGIELHGVDRLKEAPDSVQYSRLDLDSEPLPYPSDFFDVIVMTHVVEHLRHPTFMAGEIGRVLAPGGWFYVEAPNWIAAAISWPSFWDDPTHVRPWSPNGFNSLLKDYAALRVHMKGIRRNWARVPGDIVKTGVAALTGRLSESGGPMQNIVGWSCFGIGQKPL